LDFGYPIDLIFKLHYGHLNKYVLPSLTQFEDFISWIIQSKWHILKQYSHWNILLLFFTLDKHITQSNWLHCNLNIILTANSV